MFIFIVFHPNGHSFGDTIRTRSLSVANNSRQADATDWVHCDLFSATDVENALQGCEQAIYLVHSMLPSSRLVQANFQDMDLLLADNFARAAKKAGLKQIIYLGGLLPEEKEKLSPHLASRLEVEKTLERIGIPVMTLAKSVDTPGRFEFRVIPERSCVLAAIHGFVPEFLGISMRSPRQIYIFL